MWMNKFLKDKEILTKFEYDSEKECYNANNIEIKKIRDDAYKISLNILGETLVGRITNYGTIAIEFYLNSFDLDYDLDLNMMPDSKILRALGLKCTVKVEHYM